MKYSFLLLLLLNMNSAGAQTHFQYRFNYNYSTSIYRNERFNSGISTVDNNAGSLSLNYIVGIGTSYMGLKDNLANCLRFTRMTANGMGVLNNLGHEFSDSLGRAFHSFGHSITEIKNASGTGGYIAVGQVVNNIFTGSIAAGGGDVLFANLNANGNVVNASRIDINGGNDTAWCIRKSRILIDNKPTWLICGASGKSASQTDCFVARVQANGNVVWCSRFNFDPTGGTFTTAHNIAKQLCEDTNGFIYVAGTLEDAPVGANGIDGLAFKLTSGGAVLWARNFNRSLDDEFQAIRIASDGNLIIGGVTEYLRVHNMLITKLNAASGAVVYANILRANVNGVFFPCKAYDIVEAGNQFYLAGVLAMNGTNYEMLYQAGANGAGVRWNFYNSMGLNKVGVGVDYLPAPCSGGIAFFSSRAAGHSHGHIMKTDFLTRTCNLLTIRSPNSILTSLGGTSRNFLARLLSKRFNLRWTSFNFDNRPVCYTGCTVVFPPATATPNVSLPLPEQTGQGIAVESSLKTAPNPVTGTLRLQFHLLPAGEYQVSLMDIEGKLLLQSKKVYNAGSTLTGLNMSGFVPGVYLLRVSKGTLLLQQKVVKQ